VSEKEDLQKLEAEYRGNERFSAKIQELKKKYSHIRRVRGDGNCFYRSYLFGILEHFILKGNKKDEYAHFEQFETKIQDSLAFLLSQGFSDIAVEEFYNTFFKQLVWIKSSFTQNDDKDKNKNKDKDKTVKEERSEDKETKGETAISGEVSESECVRRFNDPEISDYVVVYGRFLCSGHIQSRAEEYKPFLQGKSIMDFVQSEVEAVNKESDYVQCMSLATHLGIGVQIEYLDQSSSALNSHVLPNAAVPKVFLLYRPGHYDLLYPDYHKDTIVTNVN